MERAPFQILLFPFFAPTNAEIEYAIFRRSDLASPCWQGIAGGGRQGETAEEAARREAVEEAGIKAPRRILTLDSMATLPVVRVSGFLWGLTVPVIPEYAFGAEVLTQQLILSAEHTDYRWLPFSRAHQLLTWESNRNALWELHFRLTGRTDI
ncbi:MAG TPA: NUDIX pyrophosphatase [Terriglobia bacterium]|nr:NUDIX pyrophosphatase [Terriglobia bacterium]